MRLMLRCSDMRVEETVVRGVSVVIDGEREVMGGDEVGTVLRMLSSSNEVEGVEKPGPDIS